MKPKDNTKGMKATDFIEGMTLEIKNWGKFFAGLQDKKVAKSVEAGNIVIMGGRNTAKGATGELSKDQQYVVVVIFKTRRSVETSFKWREQFGGLVVCHQKYLELLAQVRSKNLSDAEIDETFQQFLVEHGCCCSFATVARTVAAVTQQDYELFWETKEEPLYKIAIWKEAISTHMSSNKNKKASLSPEATNHNIRQQSLEINSLQEQLLESRIHSADLSRKLEKADKENVQLSKKIQKLEKDSKNGEGGEERGRGKGTRRGKGGNAALNECMPC